MTLFELLQKYGLIHGLSGDRIRWFESTAKEVGIDNNDDDGNELEDFDVLVLSGIQDSDYVNFAADAEVEDAGVYDENWVIIKSLDGVRRVFNVYKPVAFNEIVL